MSKNCAFQFIGHFDCTQNRQVSVPADKATSAGTGMANDANHGNAFASLVFPTQNWSVVNLNVT